ncbi:hypothetical protein CspeluHIS016_0111880 [Cutaneotrichosporon spelunceum]|uniref:DUF654-domain-containing protein n=1 Tax=Cutaneotrichosporon spelunceum TaxID=1672016 RepID=A0AAD3TPV1_9TREE|nr:hypothetical protein CspeluHIS016_0111880 [Cutaneotrichosporon spelunceum]
MRELEELEALKAVEKSATPDVPEEESDEDDAPGASNPFAALGGEDEPEEDADEDDVVPAPVAKKKNKKKKPKKKKNAASALLDEADSPSASSTPRGKKGKGTPVPDNEEMDEVDRALAELKLKYGEDPMPAGPEQEAAAPRSVMAFRSLLSVEPKNLDADAELRRFFGSKVIAAATTPTGGNRRHAAALAKVRYVLAKPKPTYPPPISLAGLSMRELGSEEVEDVYDRRGWLQTDTGEKWYSFEHSPAWREIERQFLGAVRSHDPNELMALLQVYPWHVDTLLQMSEVYRLQNDIGAASDFAERALYALDRCLVPGFNVQSGSCRLDFDFVENRPMFTALHRIISYLGRRGCWVTAFNFAKLLFSLDPEGDPHGAALWLDFLAVKANQGSWLLQMLEMRETSRAAALWHGYPGMGWARALALRQEEDSRKDKEHKESTAALVQAMKTFPEVVVLLADKIGANIPNEARSKPLLQIEVGYTDSPSTLLHLLAHIYVARSEALWKEPKVLAWFERTVASTLPEIDDGAARAARAEAHAIAQTPRDLDGDGELAVPLNICRHVLCSESTSWLGFLPPAISRRPFHAYDPLPPSCAQTAYDAAYFDPVARQLGARVREEAPYGAAMDRFLDEVRLHARRDPAEWAEPVRDAFTQFAGRAPEDMDAEDRQAMVRDLVRMYEQVVATIRNGGGDDLFGYAPGNDAMPGAFPG